MKFGWVAKVFELVEMELSKLFKVELSELYCINSCVLDSLS